MGCCQSDRAEGDEEVANPNNAVASNPIREAADPTVLSDAEVEAKLQKQFGGSFRRPSVDQGTNGAHTSASRYT